MISQKQILHAPQSFLYGYHLVDNVNAVLIFADHFLQSADLSFNDREPPRGPVLRIMYHVHIIPPRGIDVKFSLTNLKICVTIAENRNKEEDI